MASFKQVVFFWHSTRHFAKICDRKEGVMKKIILDCDNTIGIPNCDVDDAMALFYLLGKDEADLLAITTTYGNSDISTVHSNTKRLLREIGRTDIALYRGSEKIDCGSDAARAIAKLSEEHRGELSILAVGATTNLCSALHYDPKALDGVDLVLMGGITEPLIVGSRPMDELNLSVDARATLEVLNKTKKATILTGNNCLATIFSRSEFEKNLCHTEQGRYILESTRYWFDYNESDYDLEGFYNWDITAAVYLMRPELFEDDWSYYNLNEEDMKRGFLRRDEGGEVLLNLPKIRDIQEFKKEAYRALSGVSA